MNSIDLETIPQEGTSEADEQASNNLLEVNGQKMTPEDLKKAYDNLHSDYTRKTQELAKVTKQGEVPADPDLAAFEIRMDQRMEEKGYVKQDQLTKREQENQLGMALHDLVKDNPGLKGYETAIKELVKSTGEHPADVVERYLPDANKLLKAKSSNSDIMGTNDKGQRNVSFDNMTPAQKAEWYSKNRDNIKNSGERFSIAGGI